MIDSLQRQLLLFVAITLTSPVRAADALPQFAAVKMSVQKHLAAKSDYKPGDLLTRNAVKKLLEDVQAATGWEPADRDEILEAVLADDAPMARQLSGKEGKDLMRQVARNPDGYDRIDRVLRLPDGERIMRRLKQGPDGYKLIEYLAVTDGGHEMGKMLSKAPRGKNFNSPTGRIYTADQLLKRLEKSLAADRAAI